MATYAATVGLVTPKGGASTETVTGGEAIGQGVTVYRNGNLATSKWYILDNTISAYGLLVGFSMTKCDAADETFVVCHERGAEIDLGITITKGTPVFAAASGIVNDDPSTGLSAGNYFNYMGFANDSNNILLYPWLSTFTK